jgi:hypothetical protein
MTSGKEMDSLGEVNVPADNRGMAKRHSRGWTILNCNLMAHGKFASTSQLLKSHLSQGVTNDVLKT